MSRLYSTKNDLSEGIRKKIIKLLNDNLVDALHLSNQAKQAHWNVKGPLFYSLHELFDKLYEQSDEWSDLLAERAVQLGGTAESNLECIYNRSRLPSYSLSISDGLKHVEALIKSVSLFCKNVRKAIDQSDSDLSTADIFTEISREADKFLWFLESHLIENKKSSKS